MAGPVGLKQSHNLMSVLANNADWSLLPADLAQRIINDPTGSGRAFTQFLLNCGKISTSGKSVFFITLRGMKASKLVALGKYDYAISLITDEQFPIRNHAPIPRTIEFVAFDHDPTTEEVIAEFARRGLVRPTYEDALNFGIDHPNERGERPIVFLHEPLLRPVDNHLVLVLSDRSGYRNLELFLFGGVWGRRFVFAGVRK